MSLLDGEDEEEDHDHESEDTPELGEGWDPEDDNLQKNYMKMAAKFMKEQLQSLKEMKQDRKEAQAHAITPSRLLSQSLAGMVGLGHAAAPNVLVRKIDNGFLMTYNEVKEDRGHQHPQGVMGAGGSPFQVAVSPLAVPVAMGPQYGPPHIHKVEVFVKDAAEAAPHLQKAMDSMEKISKMGPGGFYL